MNESTPDGELNPEANPEVRELTGDAALDLLIQRENEMDPGE